MKILIIGGTVFLGRALVDAAVERGHEITLFNRGRHNPDLYPEIEKIHGDRDGELALLGGRSWDAVIDTCGYVPRVVRASADALRDLAPHYTFISTLSVYADAGKIGIDETGPVGTLEDPTVEEVTGGSYGPLKALCEQAVQDVYPDAALIVRPGLIVGPHDPSDRFAYWPLRVAGGGEVLAPVSPDYQTQFIDVRDLAEWTVRMVEAQAVGVYNATGPESPLPIGQLLETCRAVSGAEVQFTWVDGTFLLEHDVEPWMELPLWVPDDDDTRGFNAFDCARAIAAGLAFRPVRETVVDTLRWAAARPAGDAPRAGLSREKEAAVLEAWHRRTGNSTGRQES